MYGFPVSVIVFSKHIHLVGFIKLFIFFRKIRSCDICQFIPVAVIRQVFYIIAVTYIGLTDLKGTVLVIRNACLHRLLVIILGIVIGKILIKSIRA